MMERKNRSILNMTRSMLKIKKINFTTFKSLVRSLRYLTCTRPDILYGVRLVSRFMETLTMTHIKSLKANSMIYQRNHIFWLIQWLF
jgi:hypothetical protein